MPKEICIYDTADRSQVIEKLQLRGLNAFQYDVNKNLDEQFKDDVLMCIGLKKDEVHNISEYAENLHIPEERRKDIIIYSDILSEDLRFDILETGFGHSVITDMLITEVLEMLKDQLPQVDEALDGKTLIMQIEKDDLANVIQFIAWGSKNGELHLKLKDGNSTGRIYFEDCAVTHAVCGEHKGVKAVACMMKKGEADAHFHPERKPSECTIQLPVDSLLLNASVMADEGDF